MKPVEQHAGRARAVLERLRELPGGPELLEVTAATHRQGEQVELVGGAVRDILLGRPPRELDVVVSGGAHGFAAALARRLEGAPSGDRAPSGAEGTDRVDEVGAGMDEGAAEADSADERGEGGEVSEAKAIAKVTHHERFGTASVEWARGCIDIATRRSETYSSPGALPEVSAGTPEQDLLRRDFTVNAIAVPLGSGDSGGNGRQVDDSGFPSLRCAPGALEDLERHTLRVLHDRSFADDPTRILRLARYRVRLGFEVEPHTEQLAQHALGQGALETVSGSRLGSELRLALAEEDPPAALAELDRMGVFEAWEPGLCFDEPMVRTALEILPADGDPAVLMAAALVVDLMNRMGDDPDAEAATRGFLYDLEMPTGFQQRAFSAGIVANCAERWIDGAETTGEMLDLIDGASIEGLSIAAALADAESGPRCHTRRVIEDWLYKHRHIELHITGEDLIAAGVPEGPEIGRRLERVFAMRMIGLVEEGHEPELKAALEDDC